ncbi:hypothetical protein PS9374_05856 [Planomonospora sphaerica]|uniref:Uncharacterized protein n=1 Tax=Planomonospora sphaerica TaxID=161355 RepID=A0A161LRD4_9ACTN|nr:hypothetical protein [Planomonospora sphaerica]GAT70176.1 hypothetical protein PS9374_05856 [Planomonospora sphaerica]
MRLTAVFTEASAPETAQRKPSFIDLGASGRGDVSERHDELLREGLDRPS